MKSKCNLHRHVRSSPSPHFSLQVPQSSTEGEACIAGHRFTPPCGGSPWGSQLSRTRWVPFRGGARMERAAGGAPGLPQLPARGDSSEHLGVFGLSGGGFARTRVVGRSAQGWVCV